MNINIRHRTARWATVVAGTLAVASPLALAVPQANAATPAGLTVIVNKPVATCRNANGGQVPEGSTASKTITIKAPDGSTIKTTITVTCGSDGNWH
jgi:hypothetical protein